MPLVYGGDVAEAVALTLEHNSISIGKSYNLASDERVKISTLHSLWQQSGGKTAKFNIPIPVPSNSGTPISSQAAQRELGWKNRPLLECLTESFSLEKAANTV